jgi:hypothetical protein
VTLDHFVDLPRTARSYRIAVPTAIPGDVVDREAARTGLDEMQYHCAGRRLCVPAVLSDRADLFGGVAFLSAKASSAKGRSPGSLTMLMATLALLVQALVVQLHWHAPFHASGDGPATIERYAIGTIAADQETSSHACVICAEQASAGHYTLPPVPLFADELSRSPDLIAPSPLSPLSVRQASHSWHSRGPPLLSV